MFRMKSSLLCMGNLYENDHPFWEPGRRWKLYQKKNSFAELLHIAETAGKVEKEAACWAVGKRPAGYRWAVGTGEAAVVEDMRVAVHTVDHTVGHMEAVAVEDMKVVGHTVEHMEAAVVEDMKAGHLAAHI